MFDDLSDLYQQVILDHCKHPRNFRELPQATCSAQGYNPLCGDQLKLYLQIEGEVIKDIGFLGSGCCISKASASLLTENLKGRKKSEVQPIFDQVHEMVTSGKVVGEVGKLAVFAGVYKFPARVKCAILAWHAVMAALKGEGAKPVSTESEEKLNPPGRDKTAGFGYIQERFMNSSEPITLARDVEASIVPVGTQVTLQKGEQAYVTQSLGGAYTVVVNGNMFRIENKDADALGMQPEAKPTSTGAPVTREQLEKDVWAQLRNCYDPEIPVNIVDLGLIYDCHLSDLAPNSFKVDVKMTLTAPGCGMGPMLAQDVQNRILSLETVDDVAVELVWDPPWNQAMMTEAAKLQLGLL